MILTRHRPYILLSALIALGLLTSGPTLDAAPSSTPLEAAYAFVEAVNAAGSERLTELLEAHLDAGLRERNPQLVEMFEMFRDDLGAVKAEEIRKTGDDTLELILASTTSKQRARVQLTLTPQPPHRIASFGVRLLEPEVEVARNLSPEGIAAALEKRLAELAAEDAFSGTVLVAHRGKPVLQKAYGLASQRFGVPNNLETKFNLGSMNKMFTAIAIAQLAEAGKLDFQDPVGRHLPDYPNRQVAERVTLHHLLTHTSGLGSYWEELFAINWTQLRTVAELLPLFAEKPLDFEPGERFQYSNSGYIVLGRVIERISGQSYYDYVRQHIFEPAGMQDTDCYEMDDPVPNLAIGYTHPDGDHSGGGHDDADGPRRNNLFQHTAKGGPAGGGFSTVGDLLRFSNALAAGKLIRPATLEQLTRAKVKLEEGFGYGYGFGDHTRNGFRYYGHNGGAPGISADFRHFPELGFTYAVLSNYDHAAGHVGSLVRAMITERDPS